MTLYTGPALCHNHVCIGPPDFDSLRTRAVAADVRDLVTFYVQQAPLQQSIYYFGVLWHQQIIGQILLHDINETIGESLVAYHLFDVTIRNHGIGTTALSLLQHYVHTTTQLARLIIITSEDNLASQHIATKCGFQEIGRAREDPEHLLVFAWSTSDKYKQFTT